MYIVRKNKQMRILCAVFGVIKFNKLMNENVDTGK